MDLRLSPSTSSLVTRPQTGIASAGMRSGAAPAAKDEQAGFSTVLRGALGEVSAAQNKATGMAREVQLENPSVSLEETMVNIQKAQIGFQATLHVRNRMVQAYSDIMNMQV